MAFLDRARRVQDTLDGRFKTVGHGKFGRVLRMARKPAVEEYVKVLEVTWLGAVLIGVIGFFIYIFFSQIGPWLWSTYLAGL
jgi:protein transport protein SEC61 subunit gamma and related proteins